jgi:phosphoglycerate dehydrogenase-like enzyme
MGLEVYAFTASPRTTPESKKDQGFIVPGTGDPDGLVPAKWFSGLDKESLHTFLKQDLDILLISVPLTAETRHFLSTEEFKILGKTKNTFISNVSRGEILDQKALIEALKKPKEDGGLSGAALDVTDPEPLPKDSELWDLENVVITPHVSGQAKTYMDRVFQVLEVNLGHISAGEKLINVVRRNRGY